MIPFKPGDQVICTLHLGIADALEEDVVYTIKRVNLDIDFLYLEEIKGRGFFAHRFGLADNVKWYEPEDWS